MNVSDREISLWCECTFGKPPDDIKDVSSNGKSKFLRKKILRFGEIILEYNYTFSISQYGFHYLFDESSKMFNSFKQQMLLKKLELLE